ncbi:MAG: elongation factor G [Planctomycetaceae bacterium]
MSVELESIRNIGIIAHIDAGKTTTTERILYYTGTKHSMGNVDEGTTTTDFDSEEAERGITIYSAAITCKWNTCTINIIDTPGHVDFTAEVERSLRVLDGAVVIFSAVEGVEAQSETVWRQADSYGVPRICFINKMDRIGADFDRTFQQISDRLGAHPVALQIPIGAGPPHDPNGVRGIIDLITMQALYFDSESKGEKIETREIPKEFMDDALLWRQSLVETLADFDDDVMMALLEEKEIPGEQIHKILRKATLQGEIQPTFCGAALDYIGVQPILDAVERYLPSPLDRPPVEGTLPSSDKKSRKKSKVKESGSTLRKPSIEEPFCGIVFKIQTDKHADLCFFRMYSGTLDSGSRVLNPRTGKKELVSQIWRVMADSRQKIEQAIVGDIVGLIGPKDVVTGDTLCDTRHPILLESITFPETVISMAVEPDTSAERKKLAETLEQLSKQDPTFTARISEETGQTIISGMGELHLEVLRNRMEKDFGLKVRVHKPRVSYRETIRKAVEAEGEFNRKMGETTQYAKVKLKIEPFQGEESITLENLLPPETLSNELSAVLVESVLDEARAGGILGYPLMNVKLTILDADSRVGETTDLAIQAASKEAVRNCLTEAGIVLLEPIMRLEVVTPEEFLGNIQADLNARRAIIVNTEPMGDLRVVEAHAALAQMFGYSTQIRSLSQGRASYSMEPLKYDEAPPEVLREMMGE